MVTLRSLNKDDYLLYRTIRLELLKQYPENFGSSYEEEAAFPVERWIERLDKSTITTLGAFVDNEIVGLCVISYNPRKKMKHTATIHSMYVKPSHRGKGIAVSLLQKAEEDMRQHDVQRANLSVVTTNTSAHNLYKKLRYITYGEEPEVIHHDGVYYSTYLMSKQLK